MLVGDQVFLTAHARLTESGADVELAARDSQGKLQTFELTVGSEAEAMSSRANPMLIAGLSAAAAISGGFGGRAIAGPVGVFLVLGGLGLLAAVVWLLGAHNRIHRVRARAEFAWSLIDVACEQRTQVINQLQPIVGEAMANERRVLESVSAVPGLGNRPTAQSVAAVSNSSSACHQLLIQIEAMPTLTSQPNVAQLIGQLRLLNDRVEFARRFYNDSVTRLTDRLTQVPDSFIAKAAQVAAMPLLQR